MPPISFTPVKLRHTGNREDFSSQSRYIGFRLSGNVSNAGTSTFPRFIFPVFEGGICGWHPVAEGGKRLRKRPVRRSNTLSHRISSFVDSGEQDYLRCGNVDVSALAPKRPSETIRLPGEESAGRHFPERLYRVGGLHPIMEGGIPISSDYRGRLIRLPGEAGPTTGGGLSEYGGREIRCSGEETRRNSLPCKGNFAGNYITRELCYNQQQQESVLLLSVV